MTKVLVTGGAGFIGSHTVDLCLEKGYQVRVLDSLQERVHPRGLPDWLSSDAEFQQGDVADRAVMEKALEGVELVFHLAAYQDYIPEFTKFIRTNTESSALLFELAVNDPKRFPVRKIVFAASQSVCGEGRYLCPNCAGRDGVELHIARSDTSGRVHAYVPTPGLDKVLITPPARSIEQVQRGDWEMHCPTCGEYMKPALIEESTASPITTYGISKYAIELLADRLGRRYGIATACMRYSYVQGSRNSFYNAYSGIARRFALRLLHNLPPTAYEDGQQLKDYVNVKDIARANLIAMEDPRADFRVFHAGGGRAVTVLEFARMMLKEFGSDLEPQVPGDFRLGDTRHTVSDIAAMQSLGWEPTIQVEQNVAEYVAWMKEQRGTSEYLEEAERIMRQQGVVQSVQPS